MTTSYSDAGAARLHELAVQTLDADAGRAESGRRNNNVAVTDPDTGKLVNVRIPKPSGERRPHVWRSYDEAQIHAALEAGGLGSVVAGFLYAHPQGLFSLQERSGAEPFPKAGEPIPPHLAREFAAVWTALDNVELPGGPTAERPLAADAVAHLAANAPSYAGQRSAPRTSAEYAELMCCELEANANQLSLIDDFATRRLGMPDDLAAHARSHLEGMPDAPLQPTHPDMHMSNLGVKNGHLFVYDWELAGYHDRRHALVYALRNSNQRGTFLDDVKAAVVAAVPSGRRADFVDGMRRWDHFTTLQTAVRRIDRSLEVAREHAGRPNLGRTLDRFSPWLTDSLNAAAPLWGSQRTVDVTEVHATLARAAHIHQAEQPFRDVGMRPDVAAIGLGTLIGGPKTPPMGRATPSPSTPRPKLMQRPGRQLGLRLDRSP